MGIGPISLGYAYPKTDNAIIQQLKDGITFSMMHPLEVEVAEMLREIIPNAESVRYSKSGADVTSAAIRVARAYTGKNKILCCGYHGWHDWYVSTIARNAGIPQAIKDLTFTFNYDSNVQGGRTAGTDANVTAVAIGKSTGQFVSQTGTITRSTANSISLASALERNYAS